MWSGAVAVPNYVPEECGGRGIIAVSSTTKQRDSLVTLASGFGTGTKQVRKTTDCFSVSTSTQ